MKKSGGQQTGRFGEILTPLQIEKESIYKGREPFRLKALEAEIHTELNKAIPPAQF
jgi:hypothetical protein